MTALGGKVIIVTGAGSGIGAAAAEAFSGAGARLLLADRDPDALDRVRRRLAAPSREVAVQPTDVSDESQVEAMVAAAVARYGRLDGAFNNAGIGTAPASIAQESLERWHRVLEVNLTGVFLCLKHEIPALLDAGGGAIVNTSSALGQVGAVMNGAYAASKHGVLGLTRVAALEYASRGIRVNAICPGVVDTPMTAAETEAEDAGSDGDLAAVQPVGRMARPAEIAAVALFLLSDAASFVHGAAVPVDGAYLAQ